jgi:hypothetical protein
MTGSHLPLKNLDVEFVLPDNMEIFTGEGNVNSFFYDGNEIKEYDPIAKEVFAADKATLK